MTQRQIEHVLLDILVPAAVMAGILVIFATLSRLY
jgi:hypothetical protein